MSLKESSLLPTVGLNLNQNPFPFVKVFKKHLPLIFISLLLTLSLLCYVFIPQIRVDSLDGDLNEPDSGLTVHSTDTVRITVDNRDDYQNLRTKNKSVVNENHIFSTNYSHFEALPRRGHPLDLPSGDDPNSTVQAQREFVKEMMKHSWNGYVKYAWGQNELKPLSKTGHTSEIFGGDNLLGATIVDSLSTLYIMNMTQEFKKGRDWVESNIDLSQVNNDMSVFETVIRFVGGLLSAYALTNDQMFLEKARHVADRMLPAFKTETGLPLALVNPKTGQSHNYGWASGGSSILSEFGSLHLEFVYLSAVTGDRKYSQKVQNIRKIMDRMVKPYEGLYHNYVNPHNGLWGEDSISVGALGDSFYEYLIKSWVQSNGTDSQSRRMYDNAIDAISKRLVQKSRSGLTYLAKQNYGRLEHKMEHLACFTGGMFSLGSLDMTDQNRKKYFFDLGANITDTCYESYRRTATHIGPEAFYFSELEEAVALNNYEKYYILRPEVVESYFYLWRLTHNQRFRDYAWRATQAIARHCRTANGFSGIRNTSDIHSAKDDVQQTFFMAETLKYLYLIFSSDDLMPLNEWVFNTEAHPLPILSQSEAQRAGIIGGRATHSDSNPLRN